MQKFQIIQLATLLFSASILHGADHPVIEQARADSQLQDPGIQNRYSIDKMYDGNPLTSWVEGSLEDGIGEKIVLDFDRPVNADEIAIMPGYYDKKYWEHNNRVKQMILKLYIQDRLVKTLRPVFRNDMTEQGIKIPGTAFDRIEIEIAGVYPGTSWRDTCIAEIAFYRDESFIFFDRMRVPVWDNPAVTGTPPAGTFVPVVSQLEIDVAVFYPDGTFVRKLDNKEQSGLWQYYEGEVTLQILYEKGTRGVGEGRYVETNLPPGYYIEYDSYEDYAEWINRIESYNWAELSAIAEPLE